MKHLLLLVSCVLTLSTAYAGPKYNSPGNTGDTLHHAAMHKFDAGIWALTPYRTTSTDTFIYVGPDGRYYKGKVPAGGGGGGGLTSVGLTGSALFAFSNSPLTSNGDITIDFATQLPNLIFAGPSSGSAAIPTFRTLVAADFAGTTTNGYVLTLYLGVPTWRPAAGGGGGISAINDHITSTFTSSSRYAWPLFADANGNLRQYATVYIDTDATTFKVYMGDPVYGTTGIYFTAYGGGQMNYRTENSSGIHWGNTNTGGYSMHMSSNGSFIPGDPNATLGDEGTEFKYLNLDAYAALKPQAFPPANPTTGARIWLDNAGNIKAKNSSGTTVTMVSGL